jgi:mevalonate pyrophosphate decarboxylase
METTYTWRSDGPERIWMTLRNRGEPAGFSRLAGPFVTLAVRRANRHDLAALSARLETAG